VTAEEVELVHNVGRLEQLLASDATLRGDAEGVVAVDCEGVLIPDTLCPTSGKQRLSGPRPRPPRYGDCSSLDLGVVSPPESR